MCNDVFDEGSTYTVREQPTNTVNMDDSAVDHDDVRMLPDRRILQNDNVNGPIAVRFIETIIY
jgi:hypothetical protein